MSKPSHFSIVKGKSRTFYLIIVAAVAAFFAVATFALLMNFRAETDIESLGSEAVSKEASLTLTTPNTEVSLGSSFPVEVLLRSDFPTTGVDVALQYDPRFLALVQQNEDASGAMSYLDTTLSVFDIFPFADLKGRGKEEKIFTFAALAKPLEKFLGSGTVASLSFQALRRGETTIVILSQPGSVEDSNVAYIGRDILSRVGNLSIRIK